jgi:acetoin utilization deacetylase AcuC-like enzyme
MPVPVVWSADCLRHEPAGEVWLGLRDPGTELPDRALVLRAALARAGLFCYDTMTLVGPGSWEAIRGAVDAALTAADLVSSGARLAYALCRPPGHHATRGGYGGSCYLNNAAVAAQALRMAGARSR